MTQHQLKSLIEQVASDPHLQEQLRTAKTTEAMEQLLLSKGVASGSVSMQAPDERVKYLLDDDLEQAAGGAWCSYGGCIFTAFITTGVPLK